jgi:endogenous inhibitor of DNA gyrase (YacG/DUF329 family)
MANALKWTGSQAVILVGLGVFLLGCLMVCMVQPLGLFENHYSVATWVLLIGFVLAISAGTGLCAFVRCPQCRVRVLWHAVSQDAHPHGLYGLFASAKCPFCGYEAATSDVRESA